MKKSLYHGEGMYLGIDFIISPEQKPYVAEVNLGLPGGAQEYDLTHLVHFGTASDIFKRIEETSLKVYGMNFRDYLYSLPFIQILKSFKIWMDGEGPFPGQFHPALRLEDKWVQYQVVSTIALMPATMLPNHKVQFESKKLLKEKGQLVLKRRTGRGGRGFGIISDTSPLLDISQESHAFILQEYIDSRVARYSFSIRSVAFGGEFMCMYANLATRSYSNHGILTFIEKGDPLDLSDHDFLTEYFNQRSWEAEIWFGEDEPDYLRHNLYEDEVGKTVLYLPHPLYQEITDLSVKIERFYEGLDLKSLPRAYFED